MEEEKQQILGKILRIKKKAESMPQSEHWLTTAQNLRAEQQKAEKLNEQTKDQKKQMELIANNYELAVQKYRNLKSTLGNSTPDALFSKMEEEYRMNKFLAEENSEKVQFIYPDDS
jgi:tRNA(Met) C34 N-acetyltransferase TmcA